MEQIRLIKYKNRKIYRPTVGYVPLEYLSLLIKEGKSFIIHEASTSRDITKEVLVATLFQMSQDTKSIESFSLDKITNLIQNGGIAALLV